MIWSNVIFKAPWKERDTMARDLSRILHGNVKIPDNGAMPGSKQHGGAFVISFLTSYDYATAMELVTAADRNWDCWGWQSMDGAIVDVPVKQNLVKNHLPDDDITGLHQYSGQAAWILD